MEGLAHLFKTGGLPIYLNVAVSVVVIATIVERAVAYYLHSRINSVQFAQYIISLIQKGKMENAVAVARKYKHGMAKVAQVALAKANASIAEISMVIDEETTKVGPPLEKRIASLWALANIATLLGLIGTIFGLIRCFGALASVSPEQKSTFLALGISEALNNTAIGLTIAVICMGGHLVLSGVSKNFLNQLENGATSLENFLILRKKAMARGAAEPAASEASAK